MKESRADLVDAIRERRQSDNMLSSSAGRPSPVADRVRMRVCLCCLAGDHCVALGSMKFRDSKRRQNHPQEYSAGSIGMDADWSLALIVLLALPLVSVWRELQTEFARRTFDSSNIR